MTIGRISNASRFVYPDGTAADVCLMISATDETLAHRRVSDSSDRGGCTIVDSSQLVRLRAGDSGLGMTATYPLGSWSSVHGLSIRDHLDSLFGDTAENRAFFIAHRLTRQTGDWAAKCRRAAQLRSRFGTDDMAHAVLCTKTNSGDAYDGLTIVLAAGVSPCHVRFRSLPWHRVRDSLVRSRRHLSVAT